MNQVVVITGASAGIGAATAELLATRGMRLSLVARRKDALQAVAERCGPLALPIVADATRRGDVKRVVYTRAGAQARIAAYYVAVGVDP